MAEGLAATFRGAAARGRRALRRPGDQGALYHLWTSPWTAWVGFRYLKSKKSSRFLSFITVLSMLGIGLGVTAMVVVLSVMDGFEEQLKARLMTTDLHVLLTPGRDVPGFDRGFVPSGALDASPAAKTLREDPRIESVWRVTATEAILRSGKKVKGVVVKGVEQDRLARLKPQLVEEAEPQVLSERVGSESHRLPGIFVGQELAYEMGLIPGDLITLISPTEAEGPLASVPRMKRFVLEGVYHTGLPDQELSVAFTPAANVRSFLRRKDAVTHWEVTLKDFDEAPSLAADLSGKAPGFTARDWIQLNPNLFASLKLERVAMFVILAVIVVVASFNIVTTLTLMVNEKKKEISILKAMGARHGQVGAIFLGEGILIGLTGVGGGVLVAAVICAVLKRWEFISLPDVYYDRTLPVTFQPLYYVGVALSAVAIVLVACLYPSRQASRLPPLEGIRE